MSITRPDEPVAVVGAGLAGPTGASPLCALIAHRAQPPDENRVVPHGDLGVDHGVQHLIVAGWSPAELAADAELFRPAVPPPRALELEHALRALVEGEFIDEVGGSGEEFVFRYPVVHEVAYRSQLAERRARIHRGVAEALESQG